MNAPTCCPHCGRNVPITRFRFCAACYNAGHTFTLITAERLRDTADTWAWLGYPKIAAKRREYADALDAGQVPTPAEEILP